MVEMRLEGITGGGGRTEGGVLGGVGGLVDLTGGGVGGLVDLTGGLTVVAIGRRTCCLRSLGRTIDRRR